MSAVQSTLGKIITYIIDPAILLLFSAGFFLFMWGLLQLMINLDKSGKDSTGGRGKGLEHLKWGLIGMFIMLSAHGIISLISDTFGLNLYQYQSGQTQGGGNTNTDPSFYPSGYRFK